MSSPFTVRLVVRHEHRHVLVVVLPDASMVSTVNILDSANESGRVTSLGAPLGTDLHLWPRDGIDVISAGLTF